MYRDAGKSDKAIALVDQMLPKARRILGEGHSVTTGYQVCLISCLQDSKQFGREAEAWAELAAGARQRLVANDPVRATNYAALLFVQGLALLNAGKPVEAEAVLRECLAIREKNEGDLWTTSDTKALLGGSLLDPQKYTDAEPLLLSGYEGLKKRKAKIEAVLHGITCLSEALERLVGLYEATGKPGEPANRRKQLEEAKALPKPPIRGTKPMQ